MLRCSFHQLILLILAFLFGAAPLAEPMDGERGDCELTSDGKDGETESRKTEQIVDGAPNDFLNRRLPDWLGLGFEIRFRGEGRRAYNLLDDDTYLLSRFRFQTEIRPASWFRFHVQAQDSRAAGLDLEISKLVDTVDFRQAYAYLDMNRIGFRAGRTEMKYGEERLIGASNWSNTSRSFDAVRLEIEAAGGRTDIFASSVVQIDPARLNGRRNGENFFGIYSAFDEFPRDGNLDAYLLAKVVDNVVDERGDTASVEVYTAGFRVRSKWEGKSGDLELAMEAARQWGHAVGGRLSAWAGYGIVHFAPRGLGFGPQFSAELSYASGDSARDDGKVETFDQLYPTNHSKYGIVDLVGWRNIKDLRCGVDIEPFAVLELSFDFHSFWLASPWDNLYNSGGRVVVRAPDGGAENGHVGLETDITAVFSVTNRFGLGAGFGYLFPGAFLEAYAVHPSFVYAFAQYKL